jgi:hypothetical protein
MMNSNLKSYKSPMAKLYHHGITIRIILMKRIKEVFFDTLTDFRFTQAKPRFLRI